mgnify:CR=1 FL=1
MQNATTFTRAQAAQFDSLLQTMLDIASVDDTIRLDNLREAFAEFVDNDDSALAWFDWEYGRPRYRHITLSNGEVVSEPVSG